MAGQNPVKKRSQDHIIQLFVEHLAQERGVRLCITASPDKVNRTTADIDAIVGRDGAKIAIEHTSIDTRLGQREDSARFGQVLGGVEKELQRGFDARVTVIILFRSIPTGIDRTKLRRRLVDWLREHVPSMPHGYAEYEVPGLPFKLHIRKRPSANPGFYVGRFDIEDDSLPLRLRVILVEKARKLAPYVQRGYEGIVLVESDDLALMNVGLMESSVKAALAKEVPDGIHSVWYADSSPDQVEFWKVWPPVANHSV